ncbi:MAG: S41 family peptidase [Bacteroidota bacterium]
MNRYLLLLAILSLQACENVLVNEELDTDQTTVFQLLWEDFDKHYAGFTVRSLDWDSVYVSTVSEIDSGLDPVEFQEKITQILLAFEDIHVGLVIPRVGRTIYRADNPNSLKGIGSLEGYLGSISENTVFRWGRISGENMGYIHVKTFSGTIDLAAFEDIDEILSQLRDTEGLILDMRGNSGGEAASSYAVASRFIDRSFVALKAQFRNGPNHDDFDDTIDGRIDPAGPFQYLNPIVILMNKSTQSAAELFVLPLEIQPYITTVGDFTAGGMGLNSYRELPNGWNYRLTTTLTSNANGVSFEGRGIPPDEQVFITAQDSIQGIDPQLERAIELLGN